MGILTGEVSETTETFYLHCNYAPNDLYYRFKRVCL